MEQYEIKVVREGSPFHIQACWQISDHAAVRRGQAIARSDEGIEVWRANRCIYVRKAQQRH